MALGLGGAHCAKVQGPGIGTRGLGQGDGGGNGLGPAGWWLRAGWGERPQKAMLRPRDTLLRVMHSASTPMVTPWNQPRHWIGMALATR